MSIGTAFSHGGSPISRFNANLFYHSLSNQSLWGPARPTLWMFITHCVSVEHFVIGTIGLICPKSTFSTFHFYPVWCQLTPYAINISTNFSPQGFFHFGYIKEKNPFIFLTVRLVAYQSNPRTVKVNFRFFITFYLELCIAILFKCITFFLD